MSAAGVSSSTTSDPRAMRHVFVYGTLRRGQSNDIARMAANGTAPWFAGVASIRGTMFDLGAYPGVLLSGSRPIMGEVYRVTPELEERLDILEELLPEPTGEYFKRNILVNLAISPDGTAVSGAPIACFVYEINADRVGGAPEILEGDWVEYLQGRV